MTTTGKHCPHCRQSRLHIHHYQGEEVDHCRQCGGLWFEKANLDGVLAGLDPDVNQLDYADHLGAKRGASERRCPDCHQPMRLHALADTENLELDICRECEGAWVDADELCRVAHSSAIKSALQRLNQGITWRSWVFQFLSQLPVEYNLRPGTRPWGTGILIAINVLVFLAYAFNPEAANWVMAHLAISPADVVAGNEPWTLVSHMFLHGGLVHLLSNMYFLWLVGDNLEDALGRLRYLGLSLALGLGAALTSLLATPDSTIPSVGASGAIAGLFGLYMLWFPRAKLTFMVFVFQLKLPVYWYFLIWLGLNILGLTVLGGMVDYWAHIGGFVIGLGVGALMKSWVWRANPLLAHLAGAQG